MLPAYFWAQRPDDYPLTADEVCAALAECDGDITDAAQRLRVGSLILRKFVERSPRARAVIRETDDRLADVARTKLRGAVHDEDNRRVDWAIRYILNSKNARHLGWSASDDAEDARQRAVQGPLVNINLPAAAWADGTLLTAPGAAGSRQAAQQVIELHPPPGSDVADK